MISPHLAEESQGSVNNPFQFFEWSNPVCFGYENPFSSWWKHCESQMTDLPNGWWWGCPFCSFLRIPWSKWLTDPVPIPRALLGRSSLQDGNIGHMPSLCVSLCFFFFYGDVVSFSESASFKWDGGYARWKCLVSLGNSVWSHCLQLFKCLYLCHQIPKRSCMRWPEIFRIKVPGLSCLHAWNGSWFGEEDMKSTGPCCDTRAFNFGAGFRSLLRFIKGQLLIFRLVNQVLHTVTIWLWLT